MAYADQTMSTRKVVAIGIVVLLHLIIGYAFVTGLAIKVIKQTAQDLKVVDVQDQPPPPPEEPPPPEQRTVEPPPIVAPPPIVRTPTIAPPQIVAVPNPPPAPIITPAAPPAPPPPAPPRVSQAAGARGDPSQWVTTDDYPPGALREGREGVTRITWEVNETGRVENCRTTASSGSSDLDETACRVLSRRGRYSPAKDQDGRPIRSTQSRAIRWQIPKE